MDMGSLAIDLLYVILPSNPPADLLAWLFEKNGEGDVDASRKWIIKWKRERRC